MKPQCGTLLAATYTSAFGAHHNPTFQTDAQFRPERLTRELSRKRVHRDVEPRPGPNGAGIIFRELVMMNFLMTMMNQQYDWRWAPTHTHTLPIVKMKLPHEAEEQKLFSSSRLDEFTSKHQNHKSIPKLEANLIGTGRTAVKILRTTFLYFCHIPITNFQPIIPCSHTARAQKSLARSPSSGSKQIKCTSVPVKAEYQ